MLLPQEKTHKFPILTGIGAARNIPRLLRTGARYQVSGVRNTCKPDGVGVFDKKFLGNSAQVDSIGVVHLL
jgi:hypothetical protein